jgi:hypothetical protein
LLLIKQDQRLRMESLRWHTQSRALTASAIWSKPAAQALGRFERSLTGNRRHADAESPQKLSRLYGNAGIPVELS